MRLRIAWTALFTVLLADNLPGQQTTGIEVDGFAGVVSSVGVHQMLGGSLGVITSRHLLPLVEVSHVGLDHNEFAFATTISPSIARSNSVAWDFNAGLHLQFPLRRTRAVPYGLAGIGFVHSAADFTNVRFGETFVTRLRRTDAAFHFGAGIRYSLTRHFGIRPEFVTVVTKATYIRFSVGVYYQQ